MPKGKTVNLALVGCGGIAGAHLRRYEELINRGENRFRIVATVDSDISRAKAFANQINNKTGWDVNTYRSVEQWTQASLMTYKKQKPRLVANNF